MADRRDSNDLFRANINKTFLICKAALTLNITLISYRQGVRCYFSGFIEPHSGGTPPFFCLGPSSKLSTVFRSNDEQFL